MALSFSVYLVVVVASAKGVEVALVTYLNVVNLASFQYHQRVGVFT